jgi:hypothetical protein
MLILPSFWIFLLLPYFFKIQISFCMQTPVFQSFSSFGIGRTFDDELRHLVSSNINGNEVPQMRIELMTVD